MGLLAAISLLFFTTVAQLTLETSAELTAQVFSDVDVGIVPLRSRVATGEIIDLDPNAMIVASP